MVSPQMTNMSLRRIVRDSAILVGLLLTAYLFFVAAPRRKASLVFRRLCLLEG